MGGVPPRGEAHQVVLALYFVPGELAARTQLPVLADFTMPQVGDRGGHVVAPVSAKGVIVAADGNDFPAGFVRIEAVKLAPGLLFSPRGARRHEVGVDGDPGGEGGAPQPYPGPTWPAPGAGFASMSPVVSRDSPLPVLGAGEDGGSHRCNVRRQ